MQLEGDDGGDVVQHASKAAHQDGSPGVDNGAATCDGHKPSQGAVAHDHDVICPTACREHSFEQVPSLASRT